MKVVFPILSIVLSAGCAAPGADSGPTRADGAAQTRVVAAAAAGELTVLEAGRYLWVFHTGSPELEAFQKHGELAKHVTRPAAGPPDAEILDAYLATVR